MIPIRIYVIIFQNVTGNENGTDSKRKFSNPTFDRLFAQFSALIYSLTLRHPGQKPRQEGR